MNSLRAVVLAAAGASAGASLAGSTSSVFQVQITLHTGLAAPPVVAAPDPVGPPAPQPMPPGAGSPVPPVVVAPEPAPPGGGSPAPVPPVTAAPPAPSSGSAVAVRPAGGICTSQTLSDSAQATVRVMCSTGQFVSIEPAPGRPFAGSHGGAYRFNFGPGLPFASGLASAGATQLGAGTVTSLRVMNLSSRESPVEMLVSF